ncbi:DNA-processing protein DprA [Patescibacteria group bacterium]|nr:DNA-processing protein DprA [Patescibacteria group bacterium]MCG2701981.1 DNA-processing protein DprA [Candidatus Parcubacteria bacterium]MBU4265330.1 DNA-processing protein DprA [Patescibacteria group bacterium]MBU4389904.1 DNA-processing protein DprA [Patescibacteria group bacterium]MBU4397189.1 DNA-processing protein DprA [Patescibacteria group bacterium]
MEIVEIKKNESEFSGLLREIQSCPERLYCLGNVELLKEKKVLAVVGSRKISEYGKRIIKKLIPELTKAGFVIVSGMAFGVDAEVHRVCIESGGKAIVVLASGVDVISPMGNKWIYEKILNNNGLIVSELESGVRPTRESFLPRNRIISGLSLGVLVIEAGRRSGTLATAARAAQQGREVMVVPGRVTDINSGGVNWLLKNGASLVENVDDVLTAVL